MGADTPGKIVICDVRRAEPHAATVDALARAQLAAGRRGGRLRLRHASPQLLDLIAFMGLREVLPAER